MSYKIKNFGVLDDTYLWLVIYFIVTLTIRLTTASGRPAVVNSDVLNKVLINSRL